MRVLMTGAPGAGKGTQGARLAEAFAVPHIASGDILRQIIATEDSELSRAVRVINEGKLVSDETINAVILRELAKPEASRGFVLDGYPRTIPQADTLSAFLQGAGERLTAVIALKVSEATLIERLSNRLTCTVCGETYHALYYPPKVAGICDRDGSPLTVREDDRPERVRVRFALYHERTKPLLAYYRAAGLLHEVDAEGTEDTVFERVLNAVGS